MTLSLAAERGAPASLDVPDGRIMTVAAITKPANAIGFNVFAGTVLGNLTRRNDVALPPDASFLFIPGSPASGPLAGRGQAPEFKRALHRVLLRG